MELEHSFTVPVPEARAWEVLLDVEKVAPCMPGATLDSVEGDDIAGRIKVKVGPIAMTYAGKAHFTERDPAAHAVTLEAAGKETRGAGTASATVRSVLEGQGETTKVTVYTTLNVTGRPAQFGRGVMAEVGGKLIGIFASNLAGMLAAGADQPSPAPASTSPAGPDETSTDETSTAAVNGAADPRTLPLEELALPIRSYNGLRRDGIHTVGDLTALTSEQLLAIGNIGPASVTEIRQKLADRGLSLSGEPAAGQHPESQPGTSTGPAATEQGTTGPAATGPASTGPATTGPATTGQASTGLASSGPAGNGRASSNGRPAAPSAGTAPAAASSPAGPATPAASTPPASRTQPAWDPGASDDDAIDLLSVAGMPVLKRAAPAALAALVLALLVVLGLRRRKRSR